MSEKITLCGDDCNECPRYHAKSDSELKAVAELWYRVGWRDHIVSNEEIKCSGCSSHKSCTYQLVKCIQEHNVNKCNQCGQFPCDKIKVMLVRTEESKKICKTLCSKSEYEQLNKAFFYKEKNLLK